jgi:hypothetical protein
VLGLGERHERTATAVPEENDGFGAATTNPVDSRRDVARAQLVEAVRVVVEVTRRETEDGVARVRQQGTCIVH